jgi:hypothetical protein
MRIIYLTLNVTEDIATLHTSDNPQFMMVLRRGSVPDGTRLALVYNLLDKIAEDAFDAGGITDSDPRSHGAG